jgi:hypothetical protein
MTGAGDFRLPWHRSAGSSIMRPVNIALKKRYSTTQHFARSTLFRLAACYKSLLQFWGSNCELYFVIAKEFGWWNVV